MLLFLNWKKIKTPPDALEQRIRRVQRAEERREEHAETANDLASFKKAGIIDDDDDNMNAGYEAEAVVESAPAEEAASDNAPAEEALAKEAAAEDSDEA